MRGYNFIKDKDWDNKKETSIRDVLEALSYEMEKESDHIDTILTRIQKLSNKRYKELVKHANQQQHKAFKSLNSSIKEYQHTNLDDKLTLEIRQYIFKQYAKTLTDALTRNIPINDKKNDLQTRLEEKLMEVSEMLRANGQFDDSVAVFDIEVQTDAPNTLNKLVSEHLDSLEDTLNSQYAIAKTRAKEIHIALKKEIVSEYKNLKSKRGLDISKYISNLENQLTYRNLFPQIFYSIK
jgi:polyhydroxyalkanoate synthesis regulator phasin